ncbi:MAG TPA: T9SS type A sorting domain-containing protein [Cyclobacteriaceae bacterium]|jgi:hypothetical protein|nr:T9SS type A sorting domain-containing protein [Cyclobacteriaceae bacterium]
MKSILRTSICLVILLSSLTNAFSQWTETSNGLFRGYIYSLATDGTNLFAGAGGFLKPTGVFISTNNGQNWSLTNTGLTDLQVGDLLYNGGTLFAATGAGLYKSTNGGASWAASNTGLTSTNVLSFAVNGTSIFVGTTNGVFLSTNNGASWTAVNNGLTNTYGYVWSLAVSGNNIFAGTEGNGAFLSTNNGANWTAVNSGLTYPRIDLLSASGGTIIAGSSNAGLFRSTNNGTSWTNADSGLPASPNVTSCISVGTNLFISVLGRGVYISTDNGQNWTAVNNGLASKDVTSLLLSGTNLFAGTYNGVYLSSNNGTSWAPVNTGLVSSMNAFSFLTIPGGSRYVVGASSNGFYYSDNQGQDWNKAVNGLTNTDVRSVITNGTALLVATHGGGVFTSSDHGSNWTAANTGLSNLNAQCLAINGNNIYVGTDIGPFFSSNNGSSWTAINGGLTSVTAFAFNGDALFAATNTGVSISLNNGTTWKAVNNGLTNTDVRALVVSNGSIYAGTAGGVFVSNDNGSSWSTVNTGLTNLDVRFMLVDGFNLYASTAAGVFLSPDGTNWSSISTGLSYTNFRALGISGNTDAGGKLYASPLDNGVFSRPISDFKQGQRISFTPISAKTMNDASFSLSANATSSLPVTFSSSSDKITLSGNNVAILKPGSVTINANQAGDANFYNAQTSQTFCINPVKPIITITVPNENTLVLKSSSDVGNQWFRNGVIMTGETNSTLSVTDNSSSVTYSVAVVVDNCSSIQSNIVSSVVTGIEKLTKGDVAFPNPAKDKITITLNNFETNKPVEVQLIDITGKKLEAKFAIDGQQLELETINLVTGTYIIKVIQGSQVQYHKLAKD